MGGTIRKDFDSTKVTHLIACSTHGEKYRVCIQRIHMYTSSLLATFVYREFLKFFLTHPAVMALCCHISNQITYLHHHIHQCKRWVKHFALRSTGEQNICIRVWKTVYVHAIHRFIKCTFWYCGWKSLRFLPHENSDGRKGPCSLRACTVQKFRG